MEAEKAIDNFDLIRPLLVFPQEGDSFYFVQVIQRKKDHKGVVLGGSNNNSRLIKAYHLSSLEKLDVYKEEMIKLAHLFEARIGINLNPRSFEKTAFKLLRKVADQMMNKDFYNVRRSYDTVCGEHSAELDKRWIIDLDADQLHLEKEITEYIENEYNLLSTNEKTKDYKILARIPSKTGLHLITNPFNTANWSSKFEVEIHKNNPTNLYIP